MLSHAGAGREPAQVLVASGQVWHLELRRGSQTMGRQRMGSRLGRGPLSRQMGKLRPRESARTCQYGTGSSPRLHPLRGRKALEGAQRPPGPGVDCISPLRRPRGGREHSSAHGLICLMSLS